MQLHAGFYNGKIHDGQAVACGFCIFNFCPRLEFRLWSVLCIIFVCSEYYGIIMTATVAKPIFSNFIVFKFIYDRKGYFLEL